MIDSLTLFNRLTSRTKLRHMLALVRLVELRNMGRAAKDIGITQPAMSQLVADLEDLLEAQLFLRHARGVEPTPLAHDLAEVAQRIISAIEDGTEVVASRMNAEQGFIRIAYTLAAYQAVLDWALPDYVKQNPACRVQLDEVIGHTLNTTFASGDYDLVFCRQTEMADSAWSFVPCAQDRLVVVCGSHHQLAQKDTLTDEDLSKASWVAAHVATQVRRGYDKMFSDNGWSAGTETQVVSRSARVLLTVIRNTQSIALMPESIVRVWCRDGLAVQLSTDPGFPLDTLGFYWRPSKASIAVRSFVKMIAADL